MTLFHSLFSCLACAVVAAGCSPQSGESELAATPDAVAQLAEACVDIGLKACATTEGGYFNAAGRRPLYWQIQSGETSNDLEGAAYVFAVRGAGGLRAIASGADGYFYEAPSLVWIDRTPHVAVVGGMRGTGGFNADALYRWTPDAARPLVKLDNESWRDALARHLPPGLSVKKGVAFRYGDETIGARTFLWRDEDGDCCPTGGEGRLSFAIEGDRLVLKSVERAPPEA